MTIVQGCRNSNIDLPRPSSICLNKNSYIYTGVLLYIYQGLASYSSESNFISTRVSFYIFEGLSFNLQATLSYIYNWISFWFIINTKPALFTFQHFWLQLSVPFIRNYNMLRLSSSIWLATNQPFSFLLLLVLLLILIFITISLDVTCQMHWSLMKVVMVVGTLVCLNEHVR